MRPATLTDLPAPPPGRHGWPWDTAAPPDFDDATPWPSISLVIPSYNQGQYIEETLRSILLQGYPRLDLHVMDGGSTDATVEILRKYEPWLTGWTSGRDKGQSDAINRGFALGTGEIFNWICSDDVVAGGALRAVAEIFLAEPETSVVAGACFCQHDDEPAKSGPRAVEWQGWERTPYAAAIWQPSCYFRRSLVTRPELLRRDLHYCMDRELWTYFCSRHAKWHWEERVLSVYRYTGANKSVVGKRKIIEELATIYRGYVKERIPLPALLGKVWLPLVLAHLRHPSSPVRMTSLAAARGFAMLLLALYPRERVRALQREFYEYSVW